MKTDLMTFDTSSSRFIDLTHEIAGFVSRAGRDGLVNVFVPHATAGLAVVETGSGTEQDLEATVDRLLPRDDRYVHSHGSPGHGADHVLPAFLAPSLTVPVIDGEMQLGTWQSIVLVDTNRDNPQRRVRMSFIEG